MAPMVTGLDPQRHVYDATVWVLVLWTAAHLAAGTLMQLYCIARRAAGRMDGTHDIDMSNVGLYWHFAALTSVVTVAVCAGFPLAR
jgi:cytochrome c oxidase subunit I+III